MTHAPQLDYAAPPPLHRRRWVRWIAIGGMVLAMLPLTVRFAERGINRWRTNRLYAACLNHVPPPLAFTEDPTEFAGLARIVHGGSGGYFISKDWQELARSTGVNVQSAATLFLHERRTPGSGRPHLVAVDLLSIRRGVELDIHTVARAYTRGPGPQGPVLVSTAAHGGALLSRTDGLLRILSGQPDPADPSHFTIDYTVGGVPGRIDGWLKEDGSVLLEPRGAAAAAPATSPASRPATRSAEM